MYDLLVSALLNILQWKYLLPLFMGTLVGVVGGSLPGVTITMTVIVAAHAGCARRNAWAIAP